MATDITRNVRGMVTDFTCGHCFARSGYEILAAHCLWRHDDSWGQYVDGKAFAIVKCRNCSLGSLFVFDVVSDDAPQHADEPFDVDFYLAEHPEVVMVAYEPLEGIEPTCLVLMGQYPYGRNFDEQISKGIRESLNEAGNCLAVGAFHAAAAMCRRAIEYMSKDLGIEFKSGTKLFQMLLMLDQKGLIEKPLSNILHEVKERGNVGVHSEDETGMTENEVHELFNLVVAVIEYFYLKRKLIGIGNSFPRTTK